MRRAAMMRLASLVAAAACATTFLSSAGAQAGPSPTSGYQFRARVTHALVPGTGITLPASSSQLRQVREDHARPAGHL
jgi:hypothetical protein